MVEVTKAPRVALLNKIKDFEKDYVPRIKDQLETHKVLRSENTPIEWTIGLWVFAPKATLANLDSRMLTAGVKTSKVTALQDTMSPSAWNDRFR